MAEKNTIHAGYFPALAKYDMNEVKVEDPGLSRYINFEMGDFFRGAPHANRLFGKSHVSIVERLISNMMRTEVYTGKKTKAYKVVRGAFDVVEKRTKGNPIQTLVDALQNAAPKEETTRLRFGGILVPKAVDVAPQRRLDVALRNLCKGCIKASHKSKKSIELCLADEIMKAAKNDPSSFAVAKKNDLERIAKSAR